jgi:hypothetical protein
MSNPHDQFVPSPDGVGATERAQKFGYLWLRCSPLRLSVSLLCDVRLSPKKSHRIIATQMTPQRPVATGPTKEGELAPHTILKIDHVDRQIYKFPHLYGAQKWSHSSS